MLPLFGKLCQSVRQAFRGSGSIVGVLDRPSAAQETSSEPPTGHFFQKTYRPSSLTVLFLQKKHRRTIPA